jgi:hypothetical protein
MCWYTCDEASVVLFGWPWKEGEMEAKLHKNKEKKLRQREEKAAMETEINSTLQMMQAQLLQQQQLAMGQGLTLVHFSAQLERFQWDRGCS